MSETPRLRTSGLYVLERMEWDNLANLYITKVPNFIESSRASCVKEVISRMETEREENQSMARNSKMKSKSR